MGIGEGMAENGGVWYDRGEISEEDSGDGV